MTIRHILIALLVPLTWGFGFALAKAGLDHFSPLLLMGMRFLIAATVLVWFVPVPHGYLRQICGISFIAATLQYGLTFSGLARKEHRNGAIGGLRLGNRSSRSCFVLGGSWAEMQASDSQIA